MGNIFQNIENKELIFQFCINKREIIPVMLNACRNQI